MDGHVVVVGSLNIDVVVRVSRQPGPGETLAGSGVDRSYGGKGANQALAVARTGSRVSMIGRVGADDDGTAYRRRLADRGVGTDGVLTTEGVPTGQAHIRVSDDGENSIVVIAGANGELTAADIRAQAELVGSADVLLLQLEVPADAVRAALELAREHGVRSILNPSPVTDDAAELIRLADLVIVNATEYDQLGAPSDAVVTRGSEGAGWGDHTARPPKVEVVDTTGAGDTFAGSLAGALAAGHSPAEALDRAVEDSARATTWAGAQPA